MSILITGGSKGIGRGIAVHCARPDNDVFINYMHDKQAAIQAAAAVEAKGARAHLVQGDVGTASGIQTVLEAVASRVDQLDQLVHCAVRAVSQPVLEIPPEEFKRCVDLNGTALLSLVQAFRHLLVNGSTVFFMSSRGSKVAVPNYAAIGSPKALAESLVRYLAVELAPHGVRINTVSASALLTDAFRVAVPNADERFAASAAANPSGRNLTFDDVSKAVAFLASPEAEMITGRELFLDGGLYAKA